MSTGVYYTQMLEDIRVIRKKQIEQLPGPSKSYHKSCDSRDSSEGYMSAKAVAENEKNKDGFVKFIHDCLMRVDLTKDIEFILEVRVYGDYEDYDYDSETFNEWKKLAYYGIYSADYEFRSDYKNNNNNNDEFGLQYNNSNLDIQCTLERWALEYLEQVWHDCDVSFLKNASDYIKARDEKWHATSCMEFVRFSDEMRIRVSGFKDNASPLSLVQSD